jgi:transcriptional regulator with XRE-family HTH domain
MSQSEIATAIGCHESFISKWTNVESSGRRGIGDSIIQGVIDHLNIDPKFFFSELEEPVDVGDLIHNVFSLDAARKERREQERDKEVKELKGQVAALTQAVRELTRHPFTANRG